MHSKLLLYECFAMHMMTCQILVLGQNTRGVTPTEQALRAPGLTATVMQGYPRITIISVPSHAVLFSY